MVKISLNMFNFNLYDIRRIFIYISHIVADYFIGKYIKKWKINMINMNKIKYKWIKYLSNKILLKDSHFYEVRILYLK